MLQILRASSDTVKQKKCHNSAAKALAFPTVSGEVEIWIQVAQIPWPRLHDRAGFEKKSFLYTAAPASNPSCTA